VAIFSYRRAHKLAIAFLCVLGLVCLGGFYFAGDLSRFQKGISIEESRAALRGVNDPQQLDQVLKQYPSNRTLKMVALANKDATDIDAVMRRLLSEAEPRDLLKPVDLTAFGRGDLEALGRDLKIAESNLPAVKPRYEAAIKAERDRLEHDARPLAVENYTLPKFMTVIDAQHADMTTLMPRLVDARIDYYGAYEKCVALLIRDFGTYKVVNGQFIFPSQSGADRYNGAASVMAAAAKRLTDVQAEATALKQSRLERWKTFVGS
jgi:hypothetical protein